MSAPTRSATTWVVVLTAIGSLMAGLDTLAVSTALSTIRVDLAIRELRGVFGIAIAVAVFAPPRRAPALDEAALCDR